MLKRSIYLCVFGVEEKTKGPVMINFNYTKLTVHASTYVQCTSTFRRPFSSGLSVIVGVFSGVLWRNSREYQVKLLFTGVKDTYRIAGSRDGLLVRAPDSLSKRCDFESRQERRENFVLRS